MAKNKEEEVEEEVEEVLDPEDGKEKVNEGRE